ncbi:MAG TPA: LecA/PA-IL family lectin [Blastocatellia bacterium]
MRKLAPMFALAAILVATTVANADTIYLKNGSVIKGKVASFSDDQFVILLNTGSDKFVSRAQIYIGDVARIEFDGMAGAPGADAGPPQSVPQMKNDQVPARDENSPPPVAHDNTPPPRDNSGSDLRDKPAVEAPHDAAPRDTPPPDSSAGTQRDTDNSAQPATQPPPAPTDNGDSTPPLASKGPLKTASVDVIAKRDWTSSGLIVRRGDRVRIRASGVVTLDPNAGTTSGPEGIDQADPKKLMQDRPTGALIAVIGADNDDFIFIGRSNEFTAARDGLLFLSVNEGTLSDNSGSFKANIEVATAGK